MISAGIVGTGLYVPEEVRTNDWFKKLNMLPTDDIFDKSGVKERRICAKGEMSSDMEAKALLSAVENAGIDIEDIDFIFNGPVINEAIAPGHGPAVKHKAGAKNAATFTVEGTCSSLISQIATAWGMISTGTYKTIACVVGCNWTLAADYTEKTCMIMGDGAAAVIMQPVSPGKGFLAIEGAHKLQIEYNISMLQSHCSMRIL